MMELGYLFTRLNSMELQEVVCDIAQACACHVHQKWYEEDGYDQPMFVKTFESTYEASLKALDELVSSVEEIPF